MALFGGFLVSCLQKLPTDPKEVLKRVDEKIYYQSQEGLKSLSCQVNSSYIEEMFKKLEKDIPGIEQILDQVQVETRFYWKSGEGAKFIIKNLPEELPALQDSVKQIFQGTEILIVPPSEEKQFEEFHLSMKNLGNRIEIVGDNFDPKAEFQQYVVVVNPKNWKILEKRFKGRDFVSYSKPEYKSYKGKWYLSRIETLQDKTGTGQPDFQMMVELSYQEQENFWLLKELSYKITTAKTGEKVVGPVQLVFTDCKLNPPMPLDFFKTGYIEFQNKSYSESPSSSEEP